MAEPRQLTVLTLDGGGVRGVSSLLILQQLMTQINLLLAEKYDYLGDRIEPHDIFDFIGGTSTGGLIAVMLVRLGMTVQQCINAYDNLSTLVFAKKRTRAKLLWRARYRETILRDCGKNLLQEHKLDKEEPLQWAENFENAPRMHCVVVSREHTDKFTRLEPKKELFHLCSSQFTAHNILCKIHEAARATKAAWTYFPLEEIKSRYFADAGANFANPSWTLWMHCTRESESKETQKLRSKGNKKSMGPIPPVSTHPGLDFSYCRMVHIGTGTNIEGKTSPRERDEYAELIPGNFRFALALSRALKEYATGSEEAAEMMENIAAGREQFQFDPISATNGVGLVKMDRFKEIPRIRLLTSDYLHKPDVARHLGRLAGDMAREYALAHSLTVLTPAPTQTSAS